MLQGAGGDGAAAAGPVDLAAAVETMRKDVDGMFNDPMLPQTAKDKGAEVEAGFVTMANLVNMLSALSAEYKVARQAAPQGPSVAKAAPPSPPVPPQDPPSTGPPAEVKKGGGGEAMGKDAADVAKPGAEDVVVVSSQSEPARGSSGPSDEPKDRSTNRDRTPPPGKAAIAVANKSDEELLGPRKNRD